MVLTSLVSIINPRVILQPAYALLFISPAEEPVLSETFSGFPFTRFALASASQTTSCSRPSQLTHNAPPHPTYTHLHKAVQTPPSPPQIKIKMEGLPTPPNEDHLKSGGPKRQHSHSKAVKAVHRTSKRASTHGHPASPSQDSHSHASASSADGRHKRVWKACERCRMKKTKVIQTGRLHVGVSLTGLV